MGGRSDTMYFLTSYLKYIVIVIMVLLVAVLVYSTLVLGEIFVYMFLFHY